MAKPDWGELQKRFLSDHASTGICKNLRRQKCAVRRKKKTLMRWWKATA
ncbi:MAG: hypothetical protein K0S90_564 [Enterobacteriaceae bacterium]|nr:hypothetical protein [Enterobacteriaceae bacterium]